MANGGHYVKEGRVFVQDKDGTFLELVPMPDGNFNTKPAKKEDVRGASFVAAPFDPESPEFDPGIPERRTTPGPDPELSAPTAMPEGGVVGDEVSAEEGASAAQFEARHGFAQGSPEHEQRIQELTEGQLGAEEFEQRMGFARGSEEHEQYVKDIEARAAPGEATEEAAEEEAADVLDEVVEKEAADSPELEAETNAPELEGMGGRERVAYVLKNRSQFPEFNRALRSAAEQFYSDRRFRRTAVATAALGGMPEALTMVERRDEPARRERAELMAERDRLITARDKAREFNAELQKGETELAAQLFGDLLSTSAEVRGQESRLEQGRLEASAGMQAELRLADLKQQGDEVKAR